MPEILI